MAGIGGYYDANKGASVSSWADQSATAGAATQGTGAQQPVVTPSAFGSLPGLTFNGVKRMGVAALRAQASGRSVFFVGKWTSAKAVAVDYTGNPPLTVVGDSTGGVAGGAGAAAGAVHYSDANVIANSASRGAGYNDGAPRLVGWTHSAAADATAYLGATQVGATATVTYGGTWGWDTIGAGYLNGGNGDGFDGTLGAVIVLDQVAASGDITKLSTWAKQRFGTP